MRFRFDVEGVRAQFPSLCRVVNGERAVYLDGPGGSQVPKRVADKICDYLINHNANAHGSFITSYETTEIVDGGRAAMADFLGCKPAEIAFGESSSGNNFKLVFGLLNGMEKGDEVIITNIDHEGNRSPWKILADYGMVVKRVDVNPDTVQLIFEDFKSKLSPRTKIVAVNWASNGTGTITDVKKYIDEAHKVGAFTIVDAVHYAPHRPIDVKEIGADVLVCSAYKFFGPHLGVMYVHEKWHDKIKTVRVDADDNTLAPEKFETGTPNFEHIAGAAEAVEFVADIGKQYVSYFEEQTKGLSGRRKNIVAGMLAIEEYEDELSARLREGLEAIPGVKVYAVPKGEPKTSTVSFTVDGKSSADCAKFLGERGIFVWDGDFYAIALVHEVLKLTDVGGLVRLGLEPYNTEEEIERTIKAVAEFCGS